MKKWRLHTPHLSNKKSVRQNFCVLTMRNTGLFFSKVVSFLPKRSLVQSGVIQVTKDRVHREGMRNAQVESDLKNLGEKNDFPFSLTNLFILSPVGRVQGSRCVFVVALLVLPTSNNFTYTSCSHFPSRYFDHSIAITANKNKK